MLLPFWNQHTPQPTPKPEKARFTPQQAEDSPAAQTSSESIPSSPRKYSAPSILERTQTQPTPKPEKARFTPQQAEDSPAAQTSSEFIPHSPRKYCAPSILEPTHKPNPKTREGQVHPTASRRLPRRPNIKRIHSAFAPQVLCSFHFGTNTQTQPQNQRRPGSPHSKQKTPPPPKHQANSFPHLPRKYCAPSILEPTRTQPQNQRTPGSPHSKQKTPPLPKHQANPFRVHPESTLLVPFWNEQRINSPLALFPQPVQPRPGDRGGSASAAKERYSPPLKFESSFSSAVPLCTAVPDPGKIKRARAQPHRNHCGSVSGGICD